MNLGIVIVTYSSAAVIDSCLQALQPYTHPIVVVDNASPDDTCRRVRQYPVTLLANLENRGFAAAVNQGFESLQTDCILLLNPDVYLTCDPGFILSPFARPDIAAVTACLMDSNSQPEPAFQLRRLPTPATLLFEVLGLNRMIPGNPVNRRYRYLDRDWAEASPVEQPAGAFVAIRKSAWREVGGFDEQFHPLWFEDVDFFARLAAIGLRTWFLPTAAGRHVGAHSIRTLEPALRQLYWYRSLLQYAAKHFSGVWVRVIALAVGLAFAGKTVLLFVSSGKPGKLRPYASALAAILRTIVYGRPLPAAVHPA